MRTDTPRPIRLKDYRPPAFLVDRIDLDIRLDPQATQVRSRLEVRPNPDAHGRRGSFHADGDEVILKAIAVDGIELSEKAYTHTETGLVLNAAPPGPFVLEITTEINPDANTKLMGLYRSNGVFCTQCEAEGFRRITYFPDRPDILSIYTTRIEAPEETCPVLLGNGNPVSRGKVPDSDGHFAIWHDPHPKPSYLFALVGGDLGCVRDSFITQSGKSVALEIYVEPGKEGRCAYAMEALKRSMRWDERAFGREYDLDVFMIVAVSDFNMGAMENKGLNIFNDKYILADPETATDADFANIEAIIAHEYFHNWTGNRITCRDWFQLCLKEGLTVFRDQEFTSDERSRAVKRIEDVKRLRAQQFAEDAGPLAHPVRPSAYREINNFYTATVYEKGAEIVRMMKTLMGGDAFRRGMDLYFERHDGEAATVEMFMACMEQAAGRSLEGMMTWYTQAGTPDVTVTGEHDQAEARYTLTIGQSTPPTPGEPRKKPVLLPLRLALIDAKGKEIGLSSPDVNSDGIAEIAETGTTLVFEHVKERPVPSLFRDFSAPVRLIETLSAADWLILLKHDRDPFNRWEAAQRLAHDTLAEATSAIRSGHEPQFDPAFSETLISVMRDRPLDPAFRALLLTLPSDADIAREMRVNIDPDAIHLARKALRAHIANGHASDLAALYDETAADGPYRPDAEGTGRRALRNAALDLLLAGEGTDGRGLALRQFDQTDNMNDRAAALATLVGNGPSDEATAALHRFYERYQEEPLVLDKWFSVQALSPAEDALETVAALTRHERFLWRNPNRVRALVGMFAMGNPRNFNRPDGEGYRFVTEAVRRLDKDNPQVAARLLSAFRSWRTLEAIRRGKAETALRSLNESANLSVDVSDILIRTLGDENTQ